MKDGRYSRISRRGFTALLFASSMVPAGAARAALTPAEEYVTRIADDVMRLANSGQKGNALRGRFAAVLERYVNLRSIANFSLGQYQKQLPPDKKEEFYRLVSNYSAALFVYYVEDFRGSELEITSTSQQGKFTTIMSAIKLKGGGREQVRWRLVPTGGGYRVSDVNLKGIWLTISMKKRFSDTLKRSKGDFGALFAELREAETW
ncbi:MAG: ABC transporter substrate-binding protein [Rhizobiales bacterium]|nr:ABC transporter substrate-binding protein [Hyphomicrobiales bacterium]